MPHPTPGQVARMEDAEIDAIVCELITIDRIRNDVLYVPESAEGTPRRFEEQPSSEGDRWDGLS